MYQPIEDYGLIGDMRTAALVGKNGSIDWLCLPNFDSPSVFAAIVDSEKGGRFIIEPDCEVVSSKQLYWPETNVIITRFHCLEGMAELIDFMPIPHETQNIGRRLVRKVSVRSGKLPFRAYCRPAFNYARDSHKLTVTKNTATFRTQKLSLGLAASVPLKQEDKSVVTGFMLTEGQSAVFILETIDRGQKYGKDFSAGEVTQLFNETITYWRKWLSRCTYTGRWREMVHRSALLLKLLAFEPTGAIVASPTCSLPEAIGGNRNWDYRYVWIRDAAFTVYALMRIGFHEEAGKFMEWVHTRCQNANPDGSLQLVYRLDGGTQMDEEILGHFEGYKGSGPVRIGNAACGQLQLDIYGELMDSIYLYNKYGSPISYELWQNLHNIIDWVCKNWQRRDRGIWESRAKSENYVYSKLMCWVAIDRGLRLAAKRSFPADVDRWRKCRDAIYQEVMAKGWSKKRQAFVQAYGSDKLDAANLIMPLVFFVSPTDPKMLKTLDAISKSPTQGGLKSGSLVFRNKPSTAVNKRQGMEGTFNICGFWLVEALTRAGKQDRTRLEFARLMFDEMLSYANHLGLFSEQIGACGQALGNFPQAISHIALISAAYNLDRYLGKNI
jgi:GH15 family glucan-1,4-alpha-glucosidase